MRPSPSSSCRPPRRLRHSRPFAAPFSAFPEDKPSSSQFLAVSLKHAFLRGGGGTHHRPDLQHRGQLLSCAEPRVAREGGLSRSRQEVWYAQGRSSEVSRMLAAVCAGGSANFGGGRRGRSYSCKRLEDELKRCCEMGPRERGRCAAQGGVERPKWLLQRKRGRRYADTTREA